MDWRTRNGHLIGPPFTRASYKKILSVWMGDLISTAKPQYAKNSYSLDYPLFSNKRSQSAFNCSKLTIETLEQGVKYVES